MCVFFYMRSLNYRFHLHIAVLSWDILFEALLETEFIQKNGDDEDGPMSAHLVSGWDMSRKDR